MWAVVHARPRCEKKIEEFCSGKGLFAYLPMLARSHHYGKRRRIYHIPLFSGYVFIFADQNGMSMLKNFDRVANLLPVADQNLLWTQLSQIKQALDHESPIELFPHLTTGMKVRVQAGPLKGVEGFIERIKGKTRVVLNIDFIQQAIAVEVDADWLLAI